MKNVNVLNEKDLEQVNAGTEVTGTPKSARNITTQIVVTSEDNSEVIQGREWVERMNNG